MKIKFLKFIAAMLLLIVAVIACKKPVDGVSLDKSTLSLSIGKTVTLTASIVPKNAGNKAVNWSTSNSNVATVTDGLITGVGVGTATITVTTQDGGRRATCLVAVAQPIELEMIWVEGGTFTMGCTDEQIGSCFENEMPLQQVTLSSFSIAKYPVTQKQWESIMGNNPGYPIDENRPVGGATLSNMHRFIKILNEVTGKSYRLPTEAEWEYAARGGNKSKEYKYSGSHEFDEVAWHSSNSNGIAHPVGTKKQNELGVYDMSGNVWEYCSDWYGTYIGGSQTNPTGPTGGSGYVIRGGGFNVSALRCRVSARLESPGFDSQAIGFRLVHP
ncbi:MAG: SUMF1/EgtB/PvdO family nonheme iron enzyme [Bacteroidetes bacterium]|nr:SUMF1/EgtB/PvdO family nonheme iron enzyme [Bacteroidota bacterium]MCL2302829.1 SUMF1/EgtB/PvdO family nonheme iron enzyme [Lentimicrobiaceae bacterium]